MVVLCIDVIGGVIDSNRLITTQSIVSWDVDSASKSRTYWWILPTQSRSFWGTLHADQSETRKSVTTNHKPKVIPGLTGGLSHAVSPGLACRVLI